MFFFRKKSKVEAKKTKAQRNSVFFNFFFTWTAWLGISLQMRATFLVALPFKHIVHPPLDLVQYIHSFHKFNKKREDITCVCFLLKVDP